MSSIAVVYLAWVPLGVPHLERFLLSYASHAAGLPHDLMVIYNGHRADAELAPFQERLCHIPHRSHIIERPQQDVASYFEAARVCTHEYVCLLNTYSEIQAVDWLHKLFDPFKTSNVGMTGATGSWESRQIVVPLRNLRTWLRYRLHNRHWPPFPNPHIRSTGFLLPKETLLQISDCRMRTKNDAYEFESGYGSITRRLLERGLETLVVDKTGKAYAPADWAQSCTFRSGDQSQVLVSDNRTRLYAEGDGTTKRVMARAAWGDAAFADCNDSPG